MLNERGWCMIDFDSSDDELINLARTFGFVVPDDNNNIVQYLSPKAEKQGIKGSFSYNYGLLEFPFHTDTAFWSKPARYLLMKSEFESSCNTMLIDFENILNNLNPNEISIIRKSVFQLKIFNTVRLISIPFKECDQTGIRFDPNTMFPYNEYSKRAITIINEHINDVEQVSIHWTGRNVVVIDNWRMLHSRSECLNEENRIIKRIYIQ
jgi:alpha-ketoglutarate-dependent taurine dioxygenase